MLGSNPSVEAAMKFMLTRRDQTVEDCLETLDLAADLGVHYVDRRMLARSGHRPAVGRGDLAQS